MSKSKRPEQKLVSFSDLSDEMQNVQKDLEEGWLITSIYSNGKSYVAIMERKREDLPEDSLYIPARKKIKITF